MTMHVVDRPGPMLLWLRLMAKSALAVAAASGAAVTGRAAAGQWTASQDVFAAASLEAMAGSLAWCASAGLLAWIGVVVAVAALAELPGSPGAASRRAVRRAAPPALHVLLLAGLGSVTTACGDATNSDPAAVPELTRPTTSIATTSIATTTSTPTTRPTIDDRTPAPLARSAPQPDKPRARTKAPPTSTVVVVRGDTLWSIAQQALPSGSGADRVAQAWPRWYEANRAVIGPDPDLILPGTELAVPEGSGAADGRTAGDDR